MCCFSRPVGHVSATQIFARHVSQESGANRQALVYSMNVEIDEEVAMVLPIPVPPGSADDAVRFIDLSSYPKFFADMERAFQQGYRARSRGGPLAAASAKPKLRVHAVGAFVASFVPSPRDFDRLEERFRLAPAVFESRPDYGNWGFAVFQLAPRRGWLGRVKRQTIHPMAFTFPTRQPRALFFPTLHVHDGSVPEKAEFDHSLYCQSDDAVLTETMAFQRTKKPMGASVKAGRAAGLIDPDAVGLRTVVKFEQRNVDYWYDPPRCSGAHVLRGEGELFRFKLSAHAAYYRTFGHPSSRRWHDAARTKLDLLHSGMLEGLQKLTIDQRDAWHLIPVSDEVEQSWLSNDDVHVSSLDLGSARMEPSTERPLQIDLSTGTMDEIEPQIVTLAFRRVPSPKTIAEIRGALRKIVLRAVS